MAINQDIINASWEGQPKSSIEAGLKALLQRMLEVLEGPLAANSVGSDQLTQALRDAINSIGSKVPNTRTVNDKALSENITIGPGDIMVGDQTLADKLDDMDEAIGKGGQGDTSGLESRISDLEQALDNLTGVNDTTQIIDTFNEVIAFLANVNNDETLLGKLQQLQTQINSKANDNAVVKSISVNGGTAQTPTEGNVNIQVQGAQGADGKSAYQSYLDTTTDNPKKTEAEWVASLKGATGATGATGPQGNSGVSGADDLIVVHDFSGSPSDMTAGQEAVLSADAGKELADSINTAVDDSSNTDLDIEDDNGNVLMRLSGGHVKTLNFDSRLMPSQTFPITSFVGSPKAFTEVVNTDGLSLWNTGNVDTVYNAYDALVAANPDWFSREENIGKDASNTYDVRRYCLRYQHPSINSLRTDVGTEYWIDEMFKLRHIYVQAGIHPDEKWSVYGCYLAIKAILESDEDWAKFIKSNFIIDIVPLANPWGWVNNTSTNSNNKNLNRTFFNDKQAENNNIIGLITSLKGKGLVAVIDCHNTGSPNQYDLGYGYFVAKPAYSHWNYYGRITQQVAAAVRPMTKSVYPAAATGSHFYLWDATGNNGQLHEYVDSQGLLGGTFEVAEAAGVKGCLLTKAILINLINTFGTYIGQ